MSSLPVSQPLEEYSFPTFIGAKATLSHGVIAYFTTPSHADIPDFTTAYTHSPQDTYYNGDGKIARSNAPRRPAHYTPVLNMPTILENELDDLTLSSVISPASMLGTQPPNSIFLRTYRPLFGFARRNWWPTSNANPQARSMDRYFSTGENSHFYAHRAYYHRSRSAC